MDVVYLILLTVAGGLLLLDSMSDSRKQNGRRNLVLRLLPLGLFFWLLVYWLQQARIVF